MIAEAYDVALSKSLSWRIAARGVLADYLSLTKPRILLLLLITEFGAMIAAARGWPGMSLTLAALAGGALSAGGAAAGNWLFGPALEARLARTCTTPVS